jgi:glycosyltransferase involved in cell wall biosynthesis
MRIAYIAQSYPPMISGASLIVGKLATAMAERGHEVLVIAASDRADAYTVRSNNLTVLRMKSIHNPLRVNQRFLLFPFASIRRALKEFQPDIIHAHEPFQPAWAGITYARRHHVPVILTVHQVPSIVTGYLPDFPALRACIEAGLWAYSRWLMKQFHCVIASSHATAGLLESKTGVKPIVISNGIDGQVFRPRLPSDDGSAARHRWNLPRGVPLLLHVGRLDLEKRVDRVLYACAPVMQRSAAHLFIVGDGCEKEDLIKLSRELGIEDRVHFAGFVRPQDGLPGIYRMADVFITASEIETQGIVLLEAAASGLPIVAVDATCISEIVHDRVNGFLAPPHDLSALIHALTALIRDQDMAKTMGRESLRIAGGHDIHESWTMHETLYREFGVQASRVTPTRMLKKLLHRHSTKTRMEIK